MRLACWFPRLAETIFEKFAKGGDAFAPAAAGRDACATLSPRGIVALVLARLRRLETKNRFAFFHEIEPISSDGFEISHIRLEQGDFARLAREQGLLLGCLRLQIVDFGLALPQFFVWWHKQTDDHQPERDDEQDAQDPVQSLPNGGFATRTEIAVGLIHSAHLNAVKSFVTQFLGDSQKLIIFRHAISPAK